MSVCTVAQAEAIKFKDINITATPSDWSNSQMKSGNWKFYITKQFYSPDTFDRPETYEYRTEAVMTSAPAVYAGALNAMKWDGMNAANNKAGLVIASNTGDSTDYNWRCAMEVYPGTIGEKVRFIDQPRAAFCSDPICVTPCFTVPEDGNYSIESDIKNYGWLVNGLIGYGDRNMARISIFKGDDSVETDENCTEFEIKPMNVETEKYDSGKIALTKGDRIYLGVYNGTDGNLDDFIGTFKITQYDAQNEVKEVFSLGDVSFTKTEDWHFFKSKADNTDIKNYMPIYAAKPTWLNYAYGFNGGYAATTTSNWNNSKVAMANNGSIGWNKNSETFTVKTGSDDNIITYDIKEAGKYFIKVTAQNTGSFASSDGAIIKLSKLTGDTTDDTDVIGTLTVPASDGNEHICASLKELEVGDRVMLRINKNQTINNDTLKMKYSLEIVNDNLNVTCKKNGTTDVTSANQIEIGDELKFSVGFTNYSSDTIPVQSFVALYNENNVITKALAAEPKDVLGYAEEKFEMTTTVTEKVNKIVVFAWDNFSNAMAYKDMYIIE